MALFALGYKTTMESVCRHSKNQTLVGNNNAITHRSRIRRGSVYDTY